MLSGGGGAAAGGRGGAKTSPLLTPQCYHPSNTLRKFLSYTQGKRCSCTTATAAAAMQEKKQEGGGKREGGVAYHKNPGEMCIIVR